MTGGEGGGSVTIAVVARRAGVSTATVSRVLQGRAPASDDARERVLSAARELGYRPPLRRRLDASTLRRVHGLVLPDLSAAYHTELVLGHASAAADLAQSILPCATGRHADSHRGGADLATRVDGLVIASATLADPGCAVGRQDGARGPDRAAPLPGCDSVVADNLRNALGADGSPLR